MGLPGVKVGPLDPESTADFGQVNRSVSARRLIRAHSQMYPPALTRALALKRDDEHTKALYDNLAEVRGYLRGLSLENGDPVVPDGAEITGVSVRGERDRPQVITFTFASEESGRQGKWFAPYDREALSDVADTGDEYARVKEMRDRGLVEFDRAGAYEHLATREAARLRRENVALRRQVEARDAGEDVELGPEGDSRPDVSIVEENEDLRRVNSELVERVTALEALAERFGQRKVREDGQEAADVAERRREEAPAGSASDDEPVEGYDSLNAADAAKLLKDEDTSDEDRKRILAYEESHANRKTVVGAGEESLGRTG